MRKREEQITDKAINLGVLDYKKFKMVDHSGGGAHVIFEADFNRESKRKFMCKLTIDGQSAVLDKDELIMYLQM